jgi:hypothetical protein
MASGCRKMEGTASELVLLLDLTSGLDEKYDSVPLSQRGGEVQGCPPSLV